MDNDDSNSGFMLLSSQPERKQFDKVPEETLFKFKIHTSDQDGPRKVSYKLKEGRTLPYSTVISGLLT